MNETKRYRLDHPLADVHADVTCCARIDSHVQDRLPRDAVQRERWPALMPCAAEADHALRKNGGPCAACEEPGMRSALRRSGCRLNCARGSSDRNAGAPAHLFSNSNVPLQDVSMSRMTLFSTPNRCVRGGRKSERKVEFQF